MMNTFHGSCVDCSKTLQVTLEKPIEGKVKELGTSFVRMRCKCGKINPIPIFTGDGS